MLSAIASVDNPTGYCFGMHLNFDPSLDRAAIEAEATRIGDVAKPTPLRKFSRLWLEADYTDAAIRKVVRARAKAAQPIPAPGLAGAIDAAYEAQQEREDIEAPEEADGFRMLPEKGMQTRRDYTMAAHFAYLRRLCPKVGKWRLFLDQDSGMRAAVLAINSADDERNPPETGTLERAMQQVPGGKILLIPASAETRGHGTTAMAKFWAQDLAALLAGAARHGP